MPSLMNQIVRRVYLIVPLLLLLSACFVGLQDRGSGASATPIQDTVVALSNDGEPLAQAFQQSSLFSELDDYPVSLIYINQDAFAAYLNANGLNETEFLAHPGLDAFLSTLIVPSASFSAYDTAEGAYETSAGTTVVISNKDKQTLFGDVELNINDMGPAQCSLRVNEREVTNGTICFVTVPPSDFTW